MKKKIIVACGGAVATSTIVAEKVRKLCREHGIEAEVCQMRIAEIEENLQGVVLIITTARAKKEYGVPLITGMPFITGMGEGDTAKTILDVLGESV